MEAGTTTDLERIALGNGRESFVLDDEGLCLEWRRRGRGLEIRYDEITHYAAISWGFWLGTRRRILAFRRSRFRDTDGPEQLERALSRAIARKPGGLEQLSRIAYVHNVARRASSIAAARWVALICIAVYLVQLRDPFATEFGSLVSPLVVEGQAWRMFTANLLHGVSLIPLHLTLNLLGLVALAMLVERPLGALRTVVVLGCAGLAAMATCFIASPDRQVIGASGMVMGLAGAALCLELHHPDRLPAWWRIPRKPFVVVLFVQGLVDWSVPFMSGWAHIGGFVGGYLATLAVSNAAVVGDVVQPWVRFAARGFMIATVVSIAMVVPLLMREPAALERYAEQVLDVPEELTVRSYNDLAWLMATESDASPEQLGVALELAKRAVAGTDYGDPDILDTLAEVFFMRGEVKEAIQVIDQAIRLNQSEAYYREQRRRFMGERAADDRPEPPLLPWELREREERRLHQKPGVVI